MKNSGTFMSLCIVLACSSGAIAAQMTDAQSGKQPPQKLVQHTKKNGPIAFGFVGADGTVSSGSGNFKVQLDGNTYQIKIKKVDYFYSSFATTVTPTNNGYCVTNSVGGDLLVYCFDTAGAAMQSPFGFITY